MSQQSKYVPYKPDKLISVPGTCNGSKELILEKLLSDFLTLSMISTYLYTYTHK